MNKKESDTIKYPTVMFDPTLNYFKVKLNALLASYDWEAIINETISKYNKLNDTDNHVPFSSGLIDEFDAFAATFKPINLEQNILKQLNSILDEIQGFLNDKTTHLKHESKNKTQLANFWSKFKEVVDPYQKTNTTKQLAASFEFPDGQIFKHTPKTNQWIKFSSSKQEMSLAVFEICSLKYFPLSIMKDANELPQPEFTEKDMAEFNFNGSQPGSVAIKGKVLEPSHFPYELGISRCDNPKLAALPLSYLDSTGYFSLFIEARATTDSEWRTFEIDPKSSTDDGL